MRIHLIGVAGTGMGALAGLLASAGHEISGSDVAFNPPVGPALANWGIRCLEGFSVKNLDPAPDLVVIGNVCRSTNVEAMAATGRGLEVTHIAGALQRFVLHDSVPLVVAGTHGKTTTSSLCAWLLDRCGARPGFFIGGVAENFGAGFRLPVMGGPMVMEGDEYDTAYFEKTAKFLHYRSHNAILTSVEHDHVDIYPDARSYLAAFRQFIEQLPNDGFVVANADAPVVRQLVNDHARCVVHWYGTDPEHATWLLRSHQPAHEHQRFTVLHDGEVAAEVELPLIGKHNACNALAAVVATHLITQHTPTEVARHLRGFRGSKRRQELLGAPGGVRVYDDFAHHPTAVRETVTGMRARHPDGRLLVAFEPRSATACRQTHQLAYESAFDAADEVFLAPVARRELPVEERLDTRKLALQLRARGVLAASCESIRELAERLLHACEPGDTIALLSNGSFGGIHASVIEALARRAIPQNNERGTP
jgi:UDP-N-acetylmuramate: L-alanyl-gamma-D-glutamyl-meso-diaminopimelate ligase